MVSGNTDPLGVIQKSKHWPGAGANNGYDYGLVSVPEARAVEGLAPWPEGTFQRVFADIFQESFDLLVERQKKYGPKNIESQGLYGVFTRMRNDKIERIKRAFNGRVEHGEIVLDEVSDFGDESFEDALMDVANYALIMLALKRGVWGKPLA